MDEFEVIMRVIFVFLLTFISEAFGLNALFTLCNAELERNAISIPTQLIKTTNETLNVHFSFIQMESMNLLNSENLLNLTLLDPSYSKLLTSTRIKVLPLLIYTQIINESRSKRLLDCIDFVFGQFEIMTCGLQVIPSGDQLSKHQTIFKGLTSFILVVQGNLKCKLEFEERSFELKTKASAFFDSTRLHAIKNDSNDDLVLLRCEIRRPIKGISDVLNQTILQVIGTSKATYEACLKSTSNST